MCILIFCLSAITINYLCPYLKTQSLHFYTKSYSLPLKRTQLQNSLCTFSIFSFLLDVLDHHYKNFNMQTCYFSFFKTNKLLVDPILLTNHRLILYSNFKANLPDSLSNTAYHVLYLTHVCLLISVKLLLSPSLTNSTLSNPKIHSQSSIYFYQRSNYFFCFD